MLHEPGLFIAKIKDTPKELALGLLVKDRETIKLSLGMTILGMAAGIFAFGHIADRLGRRPIFLGSMVMVAAMVLVYAQLTDPLPARRRRHHGLFRQRHAGRLWRADQ